MAGSAMRRRQRFFRSMWRHEQTTIKMTIAICAQHFVQTDSHRPKVAVCDQRIQVGVQRHHELDVDSSPVSSDPMASDDYVSEYVAPAPDVTYPAPAINTWRPHLPSPTQRLLL